MGKRYANITEAATYWQCSPRTIRRYIAAGLIPGYRVGPRLVRVDLDDLDRLAQPIPNAAS